jgi:drug/metabolite transporter (DMT)-like permease
MSGLLFRERVSASVRWAVALAVVGLAVLSLHGWSVGVGEAVTLVAAAAFAAQIAMLGQWATSHNAYGVTLVQLGVVALVGAALTVVDGGPRLPASAAVWAALAFLGLVASALAFTVQTWSQSHLSATRTAVIMTSEPLWAGIVAVVVAGEPGSMRLLVGGAIVLLAMYVAEFGPRRRAGTGAVRVPVRIPVRTVAPSDA